MQHVSPTQPVKKSSILTRSYWLNFRQDLKMLLVRPDPERPARTFLILVGSFVLPVLAGALMGFVFAYKRLDLMFKRVSPTLNGQPPAVYTAMLAGALLGFGLPFLMFLVIRGSYISYFLKFVNVIGGWIIINFLLSYFVFGVFRSWRNGVEKFIYETNRYGSARFATRAEMEPYHAKPNIRGMYIGEGLRYSNEGHYLLVAGTRGGKGVNIILPNLLLGGYTGGSMVIIDPKGENAAVSARIRQAMGQKVVLLNPWNLLQDEHFKGRGLQSTPFNPLQILKPDRLNLSDDVQMIAECIVPMSAAASDHFNDRARTVVAGFLLHLVTAASKEEQHLGTLWEWLRFKDEELDELFNDMAKNQSENGGDIVRATANELSSLKKGSSREFGSVISTARRWTDFLKSPALRDSLKHADNGFNAADLTDGQTTVYVIIPADRLITHGQWLRLVTCSLMRSVIRKPGKDVCFLLDEFYALGYLSEIVNGLGAYASYGIKLFMVLQNLVQLQDTYGNNWENFISSCAVKYFFNLNDWTTAVYVSHMLGTVSIPVYDQLGRVAGSSPRALLDPSELRQMSGDMFLLVDNLPPAIVSKVPYYRYMKEGQDYDANPYYQRRQRA